MHHIKVYTMDEKVELMRELLENKARYSALIDQRIKDLSNNKKGYADCKFLSQEKKLERKGIELRKKLGIKMEGEGMLCKMCGCIFPVEKYNITGYDDCTEHRKKEAHIVRES